MVVTVTACSTILLPQCAVLIRKYIFNMIGLIMVNFMCLISQNLSANKSAFRVTPFLPILESAFAPMATVDAIVHQLANIAINVDRVQIIISVIAIEAHRTLQLVVPTMTPNFV